MIDQKVIVALDYDNQADALEFVDRIDPKSCRLKVGKEMFTLFGLILSSCCIKEVFRFSWT